VKNKDKRSVVFVAKKLEDMGFSIVATEGTANTLIKTGIVAKKVLKVHEGRPNITDMIRDRQINLIINTPAGKGPRSDDYEIRRHAILMGVPYTTTLSGAQAIVTAIESVKKKEITIKSIQEYYKM
jgi:carbamoyl-phosphate synthase large subunit